MAFVLLSRSRSKPQGSVKPVPKRKSARAQHAADSRFGFGKPVFQPPTTALPTVPVIQTKLKVGEPDDKFEEEADRVADDVMQIPDSTVSGVASLGSRAHGSTPARRAPPAVQRMCAECAEEDQKLQRMPSKPPIPPHISAITGPFESHLALHPAATSRADATVTPPLEQSINRARVGGMPLPPTARNFLEPRFGRDLSGIWIHTDQVSGEIAQGLQSRAFTVGSDIFFAPGEFEPHTSNGLRVLSHELTHAVQQGAVPTANAQAPGPHVSAGAEGAVQREVNPKQIQGAGDQQPLFESIEKHLSFRTFDPNDPRLLERRNALRIEFGSLDEEGTFALVGRLFESVGKDVIATGFQRLHRSTRAELLQIALGRLGHLAAEGLHASLTASERKPWDERLQARLVELLPAAAVRRETLEILSSRFSARHAPVAGTKLWVRLDDAGFKNSGSTSNDNGCSACPATLGSHRSDGRNTMELRGDITGNAHGVKFDFKRTVEMGTWKKVGSSWKLLKHLPPGTDDDVHNSDEDRKGDYGHIYVIDTPGPRLGDDPSKDPFSPADSNATGYAYVASFVEWVEAEVGGKRQRISDEFEWHSVTTLEKVKGQWQRDKTGLNEILPGPVPVLSPAGERP